VFKTPKKLKETRFMCVKKKIFDGLCDLYPATAENLRQRALERRMHFIKIMEE
jgi:hypothetical protein